LSTSKKQEIEERFRPVHTTVTHTHHNEEKACSGNVDLEQAINHSVTQYATVYHSFCYSADEICQPEDIYLMLTNFIILTMYDSNGKNLSNIMLMFLA
jgi:hypothetical protein